MGVVARQTLKNSTIMLIGVLIGTVSTLFIYPLNKETLAFYGELQFILSAAALLAPFANLGITQLSIRFFPEFVQERTDRRGFVGLLFIMMTTSILTFLVVSYLLRHQGLLLLEWLLPNAHDFWSNSREVIALTMISLFIGLAVSYLTNFQRVVIPSLLNSLFQKFTVPILVLLCYFSILHDGYLKWLFIGSKCIVLIVLIVYMHQLGVLNLKVDWSFLQKERIRSMAAYALFTVLASLGGILAFRIDTIMIAGMLDFESTGIYAIALFISNIMIIPNHSISPLIGAQIAQHSHDGNLSKINELYRRSAQSLLILGMGFFLLVWWNLTDIFSLTPNKDDLMQGEMVVLYLGIAKLIDMVTGLNSHVINYSKYYRLNPLLILIFGIVTVVANMYFIPRFGITGAAFATLISLTLYNAIKQIFLWLVFRMQPFGVGTIMIVGIAIIASLIGHFCPTTNLPLLDIIIRSLAISSTFGIPIYLLKLSPEINQFVNKMLNKAGLSRLIQD